MSLITVIYHPNFLSKPRQNLRTTVSYLLSKVIETQFCDFVPGFLLDASDKKKACGRIKPQKEKCSFVVWLRDKPRFSNL
jgi:hypothetical protein